jgi:N-acetylmuramoyl-L-alanine amidase
MRVVISSGHGKYVRGASGLIDEVDEARKVVPEVVDYLEGANHEAMEFHDDVSTTQNANLNAIVNFHNKQKRDLDVSVHFNAYTPTDGGRGVEVLYVTQYDLATRVSKAISEAGGLINRGAHKRSDLFFLNGTEEPAILIEVCFVDAAADVEAYQMHFDLICEAIAASIAPIPGAEEEEEDVVRATGKVSWFGGPEDMGVSPSEGLAFIYDVDDKPHIFLDEQPPNTTGLARRLDPDKFYVAMRWDYEQFSKERLAGRETALVKSTKTGREFKAHPADWGPHVDTDRVADVSPGLIRALGIETDDEVVVTYPAPGEEEKRPKKKKKTGMTKM